MMVVRIRYIIFRLKVVNRLGSVSRLSIFNSSCLSIQKVQICDGFGVLVVQLMYKIINVLFVSEVIKCVVSSVLYWVIIVEVRLVVRNIILVVRVICCQLRWFIYYYVGSVVRFIVFSFVENSQLICLGFSCYLLVSCVVIVGVVIRIFGVIVVKIMIVVSKCRDIISLVGWESVLLVRGVFDIVGCVLVKKVFFWGIFQGVIFIGIRKMLCCYGVCGM